MRITSYALIRFYGLSHLLMGCSLLLDIGELPEKVESSGDQSMNLDRSITRDRFIDLDGGDPLDAEDYGLGTRDLSDQAGGMITDEGVGGTQGGEIDGMEGSGGSMAGDAEVIGGESAGESAGDESPLGGMEPDDPNSIFSKISQTLPIEGCLISEGGVCLKQLSRSVNQRCEQWVMDFPSRSLSSWSGTRNTCDRGLLDPISIEDFSRRVKLTRALNGLSAVTALESEAMSRCAYSRDQPLSADESQPECYDDWTDQNLIYLSTQGIYGLNHTISAVMGISPFIDEDTDEMVSAQLLEYRHRLIQPGLTELEVGARGLSNCISFNQSIAPEEDQVSIYPGVGGVPLATVSPNNHRGRAVSLSLHFYFTQPTPVTDVEWTLRELNNQNIWRLISGSLSNLILMENASQYAISYNVDNPLRAMRLYESAVRWSENGVERIRKFYTYFLECGLTHPLSCDPIAQDCVTDDTHCIIKDQLSFCHPRGIVPLGQPCGPNDGLESCSDGICAYLEAAEPGTCMMFCDPSISEELPTSCASRCGGPVYTLEGEHSVCAP